jgi:hypothetical protein
LLIWEGSKILLSLTDLFCKQMPTGTVPFNQF